MDTETLTHLGVSSFWDPQMTGFLLFFLLNRLKTGTLKERHIHLDSEGLHSKPFGGRQFHGFVCVVAVLCSPTSLRVFPAFSVRVNKSDLRCLYENCCEGSKNNGQMTAALVNQLQV